ncbi:MAG: hypothetical protein V7K64_21810 [Nostoc sp.]
MLLKFFQFKQQKQTGSAFVVQWDTLVERYRQPFVIERSQRAT